jgi:hypothetical protein
MDVINICIMYLILGDFNLQGNGLREEFGRNIVAFAVLKILLQIFLLIYFRQQR